MQKILHVSDNPEHFSSIGSALAQIPANNTTPVIIEIAPGIYHISHFAEWAKAVLTPSSAMMIMPWI